MCHTYKSPKIFFYTQTPHRRPPRLVLCLYVFSYQVLQVLELKYRPIINFLSHNRLDWRLPILFNIILKKEFTFVEIIKNVVSNRRAVQRDRAPIGTIGISISIGLPARHPPLVFFFKSRVKDLAWMRKGWRPRRPAPSYVLISREAELF